MATDAVQRAHQNNNSAVSLAETTQASKSSAQVRKLAQKLRDVEASIERLSAIPDDKRSTAQNKLLKKLKQQYQKIADKIAKLASAWSMGSIKELIHNSIRRLL